MNDYPTSDALERIVATYKMRVCEVVESGFHDDVSWLFRVDFIAPAREGSIAYEGREVCGSSATVFKRDSTPRQFAEQLRTMADSLDAYWARAFPAAIPDEERK